jgi:hypothetical protein
MATIFLVIFFLAKFTSNSFQNGEIFMETNVRAMTKKGKLQPSVSLPPPPHTSEKPSSVHLLFRGESSGIWPPSDGDS